MRENTEPEKADRRNRTRREPRKARGINPRQRHRQPQRQQRKAYCGQDAKAPRSRQASQAGNRKADEASCRNPCSRQENRQTAPAHRHAPVKQIADSQHKQKPQPKVRPAGEAAVANVPKSPPAQAKCRKEEPRQQAAGCDPARRRRSSRPAQGASAPARAPAHGESPAPLPPLPMTAVRVVYIVGQNRNKAQIGRSANGVTVASVVRLYALAETDAIRPPECRMGTPRPCRWSNHVPDRGVRLRRQRGRDGVSGRERCEFSFPQSRFAGTRVYGACGKVGIQHRAHAAGAHADLRHDADQPASHTTGIPTATPEELPRLSVSWMA